MNDDVCCGIWWVREIDGGRITVVRVRNSIDGSLMVSQPKSVDSMNIEAASSKYEFICRLANC
jgi:hypothetical protein